MSNLPIHKSRYWVKNVTESLSRPKFLIRYDENTPLFAQEFDTKMAQTMQNHTAPQGSVACLCIEIITDDKGRAYLHYTPSNVLESEAK